MNNKGFTIIELIIYIAIVGMVLTAFMYFTMSVSDVRSKNYVIEEVQANARIAMNEIKKKIRSANGVNLGSSTFDTDPGVLSLSMADAGKNPTIINLDQDNGILQIKEGASSQISITSDEVNISNLIFVNLTGSSTREHIGIEVETSFNGNTEDKIYSHDISLRSSASVRE